MLMVMIGTCIYGVLVTDGDLCSRVYGIKYLDTYKLPERK